MKTRTTVQTGLLAAAAALLLVGLPGAQGAPVQIAAPLPAVAPVHQTTADSWMENELVSCPTGYCAVCLILAALLNCPGGTYVYCGPVAGQGCVCIIYCIPNVNTVIRRADAPMPA